VTTENQQMDNGQRLGKGMIIAAWVLLLLLLTWFFNDRLDAQRNPNRQLATATATEIPEVRLVRNRFGHYVASGTINGHPVEFMLDTGATDVSIPAAVSDWNAVVALTTRRQTVPLLPGKPRWPKFSSAPCASDRSQPASIRMAVTQPFCSA
jgi:hypothetical protein